MHFLICSSWLVFSIKKYIDLYGYVQTHLLPRNVQTYFHIYRCLWKHVLPTTQSSRQQWARSTDELGTQLVWEQPGTATQSQLHDQNLWVNQGPPFAI